MIGSADVALVVALVVLVGGGALALLAVLVPIAGAVLFALVAVVAEVGHTLARRVRAPRSPAARPCGRHRRTQPERQHR